MEHIVHGGVYNMFSIHHICKPLGAYGVNKLCFLSPNILHYLCFIYTFHETMKPYLPIFN